jgi:hypothetical protein
LDLWRSPQAMDRSSERSVGRSVRPSDGEQLQNVVEKIV